MQSLWSPVRLSSLITAVVFVLQNNRVARCAQEYYGKRLGVLHETKYPGKVFHYNCQGVVWLGNATRLLVSHFTYKPSFFSRENVTFWIGPAERTGVISKDMAPNSNGIYLKPKAMRTRSYWNASSSYLLVNETKPKSIDLKDIATMVSRRAQQLKKLENDAHASKKRNGDLDHPKEAENKPKSIYILTGGGDDPVLVTNRPRGSIASSTVQSVVRIESEKRRIKRQLANLWKLVFERLQRKLINGSSLNSKQHEDDNGASCVRPLRWYNGKASIVLELPPDSTISDFQWLAIYDHGNDRSIASITIPPTVSSLVPTPQKISGFKPSHPNYKVNSSWIQIVDRRTFNISNFSCEPCPPGTYFMIGGSLLPNPNGQVIPMLSDDGKFECNELDAFYRKETVVVKLPGIWETSDITWLSVFNLPKKQSLSGVFLLKSLVVPPYLSDVVVSYFGGHQRGLRHSFVMTEV